MVETYYSIAEMEKGFREIFNSQRGKIKSIEDIMNLENSMYAGTGAYYYGRQVGTEKGLSEIRAETDNLEKQLNGELAKIKNAGATQGTLGLKAACFYGYEDKNQLYDIKFNIVDKNGKLLAKGGRKLLNTNNVYEFSGISQKIAKLIEEGETKVEIDSLYLNYGSFESKAYSTTDRAFVKNLPDMKVDSSKIRLNRTSGFAK